MDVSLTVLEILMHKARK